MSLGYLGLWKSLSKLETTYIHKQYCKEKHPAKKKKKTFPRTVQNIQQQNGCVDKNLQRGLLQQIFQRKQKRHNKNLECN